MFQHLLFKFILILGRQALSFSVTVDPSLRKSGRCISFPSSHNGSSGYGGICDVGWRRKGCSCPENTLNSAIVSTFNLQLSSGNRGDSPKSHVASQPFKRAVEEKINPDFLVCQQCSGKMLRGSQDWKATVSAIHWRVRSAILLHGFPGCRCFSDEPRDTFFPGEFLHGD